MQNKASLILERLTNYRRFSTTWVFAIAGLDVVSFGGRNSEAPAIANTCSLYVTPLKALAILIFLSISLTCLATDLLVVGKDTFYLKTYPLEVLHLKYRPFDLDKQEVNKSNQYPGYVAVWRIIDEKLFLETILSFNEDNRREENIAALFKKNGVSFQMKDNQVFANWFSILYYPMEPYEPHDKYVFLVGSYNMKEEDKRALIRFEKGRVTMDKLLKDNR